MSTIQERPRFISGVPPVQKRSIYAKAMCPIGGVVNSFLKGVSGTLRSRGCLRLWESGNWYLGRRINEACKQNVEIWETWTFTPKIPAIWQSRNRAPGRNYNEIPRLECLVLFVLTIFVNIFFKHGFVLRLQKGDDSPPNITAVLPRMPWENCHAVPSHLLPHSHSPRQ